MQRGLLAAIALLSLAACGGNMPPASDAGAPLPGTYENVSMIFTASCAFRSCHGGAGAGAAQLNLERAIAMGTLREELVDRASCQYDDLPRVRAGDPMNSWLYLKIAGPHTGTRLDFTPDPSWDEGGLVPDATGRYPNSTCPLVEAGQISFGAMMPAGSMGLDASRAETIRLWIEAGAPGPR